MALNAKSLFSDKISPPTFPTSYGNKPVVILTVVSLALMEHNCRHQPIINVKYCVTCEHPQT